MISDHPLRKQMGRIIAACAYPNLARLDPEMTCVKAADIAPGTLIGDATDQIISLSAGEGWRPIETAPRDGALALFAYRNGDVFIAPDVMPEPMDRTVALRLAAAGQWPDHQAYAITHWMPLPAAPRPDEGGGR